MAQQYFIGIIAPPDVNEQVLQWKHFMQERFGCKVALRSPAHITLVPPFFLKEEQENDLLGALEFHAQHQQSFEIRLQNFAAFKPRVIYVNVEHNQPLATMKKSLEEFLLVSGYPIKRETRAFHPHVTIANRDLKKEDFPAAWQHFERLQYDAAFMAEGATLFRSGKDGWQVRGTIYNAG